MRPYRYVDLAVTPNGRLADSSPLGKGPRRLSDYEREIAHALMRKGHPESEAIAMARGLLNKAARAGRYGRGKAGAKTIAGARASIAQRKDFSNSYLDEKRDATGKWTGTFSLHPTEAAVMDAQEHLRRAGNALTRRNAKKKLAWRQFQRDAYLKTPEGARTLLDPRRASAKESYLSYLRSQR